jgi:hypothetical protein
MDGVFYGLRSDRVHSERLGTFLLVTFRYREKREMGIGKSEGGGVLYYCKVAKLYD